MNASAEPAWPSSPEEKVRERQSMAIAASLAIAVFLLQMLTNGQYGYFRDELYYIACSKHLAFGYVDMAPLAPFLLRICRAIFGDFPALHTADSRASDSPSVHASIVTIEGWLSISIPSCGGMVG